MMLSVICPTLMPRCGFIYRRPSRFRGRLRKSLLLLRHRGKPSVLMGLINISEGKRRLSLCKYVTQKKTQHIDTQNALQEIRGCVSFKSTIPRSRNI